MSHHTENEQHLQAGGLGSMERGPEAPDTRAESTQRETGHSTAGHSTAGSESGHLPGTELVPEGEREELGLRLQHALSNFVDDPRQAVEEADTVFEKIAERMTDALTERRRQLRASWQHSDTETETEELRLALKQYRQISEGLLHSSASAGR